jgi:hypothetical protein
MSLPLHRYRVRPSATETIPLTLPTVIINDRYSSLQVTVGNGEQRSVMITVRYGG